MLSTEKFIIMSLVLAFTLLFMSHLGQALNNGLARKPPMGWIAGDRFTCNCTEDADNCINELLFKRMTVRLVADDYSKAGYEYIHIDDCWSELERDNGTQQLVPNLDKFPENIAGLSKFVQGNGLKLGISGNCGTKTCAGYPAQLKSEVDLEDNYFKLDAKTLAGWQIDSFKFDGCYLEPMKAESICPRMSHFLGAVSTEVGSKSVLHLCQWPVYMNRKSVKPDYDLVARSCNTWRYHDDVEDSWLSVLGIVDHTIKIQDTIVQYHGPGQWFDPGQLMIGNFGLSLEQARAQMALWSIWSAPLYMSNDLRSIDREMADVLKNDNLIDVNQDQLGVFGLMVAEADGGRLQAFVKPVEPIWNGCPSFVIAYLNRYTLGNVRKVTFKLRDLLRKAAIGVAAKRYLEIYEPNQSPGGKFDADFCLRRLTHGMTKDPSPPQLLVQPVFQERIQTLEESPVEYVVLDLFDSIELSIDLPKVTLNSSLELPVNPSGVTIVHLKESFIYS